MATDDVIGRLERIVVQGGTITTRALADVHPEVRELSVSQYRVFALVASAPDGLRVTEIAQLAATRPQATTRLVQRLEAKGFVRLERGSPSDRRAVTVFTSEQGARAWSEISTRRQHLLAEALSSASLPPGTDRVLDIVGEALEGFTARPANRTP